jgi:hypothetical protein
LIELGCWRIAGDCDPHFKRRLRADPMDAQRRQKADDALWHSKGCFCKRAVLAECAPRQAVDASGDSFEPACGDQSGERHRWEAVLCQIARAQQRPMLGQREDGLFESRSRAMLESVAFASYLSIKDEKMQRGRERLAVPS